MREILRPFTCLLICFLTVVMLPVVSVADGPVRGEMANFVMHPTPKPLSEIKFQDKNGETLSLGDFKGKLVFFHLWATWCAPCRREMPNVDFLQTKYMGRAFQVIALSLDRKGIDAVASFYRDVGISNLTIYLDQEAKTARKLRARGLPLTILLDAKGEEIGRLVGPANWKSHDAQRLIEFFIEK